MAGSDSVLAPRLRSAVERMLPIRGHTANGLRQELTLRVYAPADEGHTCWGCIDAAGQSFEFGSRDEAVALLDEYLRAAFERATSGPDDLET